MKYYKLSMDMDRDKDVIFHFKKNYDIPQNTLIVGKRFDDWDGNFEFFYDDGEGEEWTDLIANDKGWFVVSAKLKALLEKVNTEIQFFEVKVTDKNGCICGKKFYIANIIKVVDALCLEKSVYFSTEIEGLGTIYTVSKYGIYENKTEGADVFKLAQRQEIPIFVSDKFKQLVENEGITGIKFTEICVDLSYVNKA